MHSDAPESTGQNPADDGPDGTTRDPGDDRSPKQRWRPGGQPVKHDEPVPFPQSDTAVSQADGAA